MATITPNIEILFALLFIFFFACILLWMRKNKNSVIANWPIVGMLPTLLFNLNHIHEFAVTLLKASGGTFEFKGPWFSNMDVVVTSDPANVNHVFNKSFANYPKGPEFVDIFSKALGDGILAVDSDLWVFQRKMVHKYFKDTKFQLFLERTVQEKVAKSLYPILDHACARGTEFNVEDVIQRLGFDIICSLILGYDPKCLTLEFPTVTYEKAINEMEEAVLYRHVVPEKYWKLMRWLQLGEEKKLIKACNTYDRFVYQCIESKREKHRSSEYEYEYEYKYDFLTAYLLEETSQDFSLPASVSNPNKFLRDVATNLVIAGRDTSSAALSWLFWLLTKNPHVEDKIMEEINDNLHPNGSRSVFSMQELNKLVYLHATMCETLRLYPSVPVNHKAAVQRDTLPSGHKVDVNTKIFISYYAMGRMEAIWGKDCLEFKPERWISPNGSQIIHSPSYKFSAFGAGPRSCVGKDMSFVQMKIIAVAILLKYRLLIDEDSPVEPSNSVILHMKHGLMVRVKKRSHG